MEVKFLEDWNTKEEIWYCDRFAQLSEESSTCGGFQNGSGSHVVHDDLIGLGGHDGHDGHDGHGQHLTAGENVHCGSRPRPPATRC